MRIAFKTLLPLLVCSAALPTLAAEISYVNQFRNVAYTQTDNATLNAQGAFFAATAAVASDATAAYDSGTMTIGDTATGPSYTLMSIDGGQTFGLQTATLPSQAVMDTQFPLSSTYTFVLTGGPNSASATLDLGDNHYAAAPPMLTGNSFASLQGMDSSQPLSLSFNPFDAVPGADSQFIFLSIYDYTAGTSVNPLSFAPPTTTGVTLGAGLLAPGHDYGFELIYSVRMNLPGDGAFYTPQVGFDLRTTGLFTTAVPEPATGMLWLLGLTGLMARVRTSRPGWSSRR